MLYVCVTEMNTADIHTQVNVSGEVAYGSQPDTFVACTSFRLRSG